MRRRERTSPRADGLQDSALWSCCSDTGSRREHRRGYSRHDSDMSVSIAGLRAALHDTELCLLVAVLAMNYTLMRPSPVDLLFIFFLPD